METLFITKHPFNGRYMLKDAAGHYIGGFDTEEEAVRWCETNGYKYRKEIK